MRIKAKARKNIEFYRDYHFELGEDKYLDSISLRGPIEQVSKKFSITPVAKFINDDEDEYTALECFYTAETYGKYLRCEKDELRILYEMLYGKIMANLTIAMYVEDLVDRIFLPCEITDLEEPLWFKTAIANQYAKTVGYKDFKYHTLHAYINTPNTFDTIVEYDRCITEKARVEFIKF
jgi:hypothetical protein